jgi:hypothetical protein
MPRGPLRSARVQHTPDKGLVQYAPSKAGRRWRRHVRTAPVGKDGAQSSGTTRVSMNAAMPQSMRWRLAREPGLVPTAMSTAGA